MKRLKWVFSLEETETRAFLLHVLITKLPKGRFARRRRGLRVGGQVCG